MLGEALSAVREAIRERETGLAHLASVGQFFTPSGNAGIHDSSSAPQSGPLTAASTCQGLPSECSTYLSDAPADQNHEVSEIVLSSVLVFPCQNTAPAASGVV